MVRRCDLGNMSADCAKRQVRCVFHDDGCESVIKQYLLEDHILQCKDKFMGKAYKKVVSGMQQLKLEIEGLRSEKTLLLSKVDSLEGGLKKFHGNTEFLKQQNVQLKSVVLNELSFLHASCKPCESLSMECIRTSLEHQVVYLNPADEHVTFRLMNYLTHKDSGQVWYSPSFYIKHGYHFSLAFHPNGVGVGKGTHMAVFFTKCWTSLTLISHGRSFSSKTWKLASCGKNYPRISISRHPAKSALQV